MTVTVERSIRRAARILADAEHALAFTGAGISTPSGIPDFRSPDSGLWRQVNPFEVASHWGFERDPEKFFAWVQPLALAITQARPNVAHHALAALESAGLLEAVITQNIDGLHQQAGSHTVHEVHGHLREAVCRACETVYPSQGLLERFITTGKVPRCTCGGVLKPKVVLFGEPLPPDVLRAVEKRIAQCDVILVAGSSLFVEPAGDWPAEVAANGGQLIIVNRTPTPFDDQAAVVIHADVSEVLPAIAKQVGVKVLSLRQQIRLRVQLTIDHIVPQL